MAKPTKFESLPDQEQEVMKNLHRIASQHQNSHPKLAVLELNPELYPFQKLGQHTHSAPENMPLDKALADEFAASIDPRYSSLEQTVRKYTQSTFDMVPDESRLISNGRLRSRILSYPHQELVDLVLYHLAVTGANKAAGSALVISKMADFLGVRIKEDEDPVPVRNILELGFDEVFLTIPNTASTNNIGMFETPAASKHNGEAIKSIRAKTTQHAIQRLGKKPLEVGITLSGTVNKAEIDETGELTGRQVIGRASSGNLALTQSKRLGFTSPTVTEVTIVETETGYKMRTGPHKTIESTQDLSDLMHDTAQSMTDLTQVEHVYDEEGTLRIKQREY